jgi:hypothetical protein
MIKVGLQAIGPISRTVENAQDLNLGTDNPVRYYEWCIRNDPFTGTELVWGGHAKKLKPKKNKGQTTRYLAECPFQSYATR